MVFLDLRKTTHFEVEKEVVYAVAGGPAAPAPAPRAMLGLKPREGDRASVRVAEGQDPEVIRSVTPKLKEMLGL